MRKRLLYGSGVVLLLILVTLVVWQGSFDFGTYGPADPAQTLTLWGVSTLIFVLMVWLGFMLVRTGVKLLVERRTNREGSRIKTKLVVGALALSFMPVFFMLLFSYEVMNRNLEKWFAKPVQVQRADFIEIANALSREVQDRVNLQASLLASLPETRLQLAGGTVFPGYLEQFCREQNLWGASLYRAGRAAPVAFCGHGERSKTFQGDFALANRPVYWVGQQIGYVQAVASVPVDVVRTRREVEKFNEYYQGLESGHRSIRQRNILLLSLISLFILFVAMWIALFLSKQISVPIAALAHAAQEVGRGNLAYRVDVGANDELVGLVQGFNRMTEQLEANRCELDARRSFTETILENIPTGVISLSSDGRIQRVNRALRTILPEELVVTAQRLEDLFPREDAAEMRYLMNRARRTGIASQQLDLKFGSQTLYLAVTVSALQDRALLNSGFVMVIEDTSDVFRAQQAAAWKEVARRVAHEIKNPLTSISLSAERVSRQVSRVELPPPVGRIVRECTETILSEVHSVKSLADEFAQFARFPAAQPTLCSLNQIVENALAVFAGRLGNIEIRTDLASHLSPILVDPEQFKRVVVNLIDNAAEAMQDCPLRRLHILTQAGIGETVELLSKIRVKASRRKRKPSCFFHISQPRGGEPAWALPL